LSNISQSVITNETQAPGYRLPWRKTADRLLFRLGEVTLWTGATGMGKSQVLSHALVAMGEQGARVCVASLEMAPGQQLRRMVKQAGNVDRPPEAYIREVVDWLDGWVWMFGLVGKTAVSRIIEVFEYARCRYGCDTFVIDSLMRLGVSSEDYEGQEKAVFELVTWAVAKSVHVHLVAHARKSDRAAMHAVPDVEDVGTSEIASNAANIIGIWRNKKLEDQIRDAAEAAERGDVAAQATPPHFVSASSPCAPGCSTTSTGILTAAVSRCCPGSTLPLLQLKPSPRSRAIWACPFCGPWSRMVRACLSR
jgi:twinkle protein